MSTGPRVLILGSAGQLGRQLQLSFSGAGEILTCGRNTVDLADHEQVRKFVRSTAPDIILNAGAYTAVDRAESEPDLARAVNARAASMLSSAVSFSRIRCATSRMLGSVMIDMCSASTEQISNCCPASTSQPKNGLSRLLRKSNLREQAARRTRPR